MKKIITLCVMSFFCLNASWAQNNTDTSVEQAFRFVEEMPVYPGGPDAMNAFLVQHLEYPEITRIHNIQGTVLIEFIVEKDGSVSNVNVKVPVHPLLDSASVNAVRQLSGWQPATNQGTPVRCYYNVPITFRIADNASTKQPMTAKEARKAAKSFYPNENHTPQK